MGYLKRLIVLSAAMFCLAKGAAANEEKFAYIDRMPMPDGTEISSVTRSDPDTGIIISQTIYRQDVHDVVIESYVVEANCKEGSDLTSDKDTFIVAVKYKPKKPRQFAVAMLHDIFKQVYVRDRDNRIRAYDDLNGHEMIALTDAFKPECPKI